MIFKTFDSDKDTFSSQFGIFGKTFEDIGNRFKKVSEELIVTNDYTISNIANAWKNSSIKKDLSDKFIITQSDIKDKLKDLSVYEKDPSDILNKLSKVNEASKIDLTVWQKYFDTLAEGEKWQVKFVQENDLTKISLDDVKNAQNAARQSAIAYNHGLEQMTIGAKAANIAIKGLAIAGNVVVGILAGFVISKTIEGLDNLAHAADNAKEAAESFSNSFQSMNEEFSSNDSKLSELQEQYTKLSKGVDTLGRNVSLTTDEYDTYKQVISEISNMMPDMLARYDDEGNKIGFVQGKLKDLSAEYDNYKKKKALDLVTGKNDNGDSVKDVFENYGYQIYHVNAGGTTVGNPKMFGSSNYEKITQLQAEIDSGYDGVFGKHKLTNEDIEEKTALIQKYQSEIDASVASIRDVISAIGQSGDAYYTLTDQQQQLFDTYVNSLSQDVIDKNQLYSENATRKFVNNLINDIKSNKGQVVEAYTELFTFDVDDTKLNPIEIKEQIDQLVQNLANAIGEEDWEDLKIRLGFSFVDDDASNYEKELPKINAAYNSIVNRFKTKIDARDVQQIKNGTQERPSNEDASKIATFLDMNGISQDLDSLTEFNEVTADITDADEAIQAWTDHVKEAGGEVKGLPTSMAEAWKQLKASTDDSTKGVADALTALADKGELTIKTFSETDGAKNYFDGLSMSAEEAVKYINSLSDKNSQLGQMSKNIQDITGALGTKLSDGIVSVDDFTGFDATIKGLDSWDEFTKLLGDSSSSMAECQEAANKLATEYVNENATLSLLNDSNREYYEAQLSKMGITNATAVVEAALAKNLGEEKVATEEAIKAGLNLNGVKITAENATDLFANATVSEIAELAKEAQQSGVSAQALALLALKKLNNPTLTTDGDIQNLLALCEGLDLATQAIRAYQNIKSSVLDDNGNIKANNSQEAIQKQEALDNSFAAMKNLTKVNIEQKVNTTPSVGGSGSNGGGGGSSSSTKKKTPLEKLQDWLSTLFDWIEVKLERQTDKISKYISKAESQLDDKKYSSSAKNYSNAIDATNVQVGYEETARDKYYAQASQILDKAVASKVISQKTSDVIATRVKNGSMNISEYSDEIQDVISAYQEWYNKGKDASDALEELHKNIRTYIQDLKDVRDKQRDTKIDSITGYNDIATGTVANSTSAKNSQLNASNSALKKQNSTYGTYVKNVTSDTNGVAKSGNKSISSALKKAKNTKYKKALQNAQKAIKNKRAVSSSDLSVISKYSTYVYNRLYAYNVALENAETARMEYATAYYSNYADTMKNIVEKYSNKDDATNGAMDLNSSKSDNAITAKSKNNYIDKQMAGYDRIASDNQAEINEYTKTVKSAKKTIGKSATAKAYSGLKSSTKKAVSKAVSSAQAQAKSGKVISASTISKLTEYYKKGYIKGAFYLACIRYNNAVESLDQANKQKEIDKQTAIAQKAELAQQKFSNISTEMDNKRHKYEQTATELNNKMSILEERGNSTSSVWYQRLKATEQSTNNGLVNKRNALIQSLNEAISAGNIEEGSEKWAEMQSQIDDVTNSIDASTKALAEYDNQIMQVHWDRIDEYANKLDNLVSETNFVINELSRRDLTSDKTGGLTDEGNAVAGLHVSNYQTYSEQARTYRDEIETINKKIASDPYNQKLIAHKEELVKSYQDAIAGAQDEKYAVIDLIENGYASLKNHISDLIDQYNDLISSEKNAYDYANNISDKTQQIANLRKQLAAYSGDVSEEARAKVQELNVSLKGAEKDLKDTQFDQYISATQDMLSDFQDDLDESIQDIIDSLDDQFTKLINSVNQYWSDSNNTVNSLLAQIGYNATRTWNQMSSDGEVSSNTSTAINGIYQFLQTAWEKYDQDAKNTNVTTGITNVTADTVNVSQKDSNDGKSDNKSDTANGNGGTSIDDAGLINNDLSNKAEQERLAKEQAARDYAATEAILKAQQKANEKAARQEDARKKAEADAKKNAQSQTGSTGGFQTVGAMNLPTTSSSSNGKKLSKAQSKRIQSFINENLINPPKGKKISDYDAFNQNIWKKYGTKSNGKILSREALQQLAALTGYAFSNKSTSAFWQTLHKSGIKGFRRGSEGIPYDMIANLGEDGTELQYDISKGVLKSVGQNDMIFTAEQAKTLMDFAKNPMMFSNMYTGNAFRMPNMPVTNRTDNDINITIGDVNLEGVQNPQQFASSMKDAIKNNTGGVRNMIKDTTVGSLSSNHNSLGIRKY